MKAKYILLLFFPIICFSQNEKLRIETIDVFKEYSPAISNSFKISTQPIFNDTLQGNIISYKSIIDTSLLIKEKFTIVSSPKFRLNKPNNNHQHNYSLDLGSHSFINAKLHYTNGLSVKHNTGFYLEYDSEDYGVKKPHYKKHNGQIYSGIKLYTSRFWDTKIFNSVATFDINSGLYWGGVDHISIDSVEKYTGNNLAINMSLNQTSKESLFSSLNFKFNYFFNNYQYNETLLETSVNFKATKSLKTYFLNFSSQLVNSNLSNLIVNSPNINPIPHISVYTEDYLSMDMISDIIIESEFLVSGNQVFDYYAGFNIVYGGWSNYETSTFLLFPSIKLLKQIDDFQRIKFEFTKELKYNSFSGLVNQIPFLDPYYKNSFSKIFNSNFTYNRLFSKNLSFIAVLGYNIFEDYPIPCLVNDSSQEHINALSIYLSQFQGFDVSSSLNFSRSNYNFNISASLNMMSSRTHINYMLMPRFKLNSHFDINLFRSLHLIADAVFVGSRDVVRVSSTIPHSYSDIPSYLNLNLGLKYILNDIVLSLDFRNILAHEIYFFDRYYDDDGFKLRLGFSYKF